MGMIMRGQDHSVAVARGATLADLDPVEFERFRRLCRGAGDDVAGLSDCGQVSAARRISAGVPRLRGLI
jgi:ATP-dependent DNA helicase RecG